MYPASHDPFLRPVEIRDTVLDQSTFLRKVYLLVTGSVLVSGVAAAFASLWGPPVVTTSGLAIPPLVALVLAHPFIAIIALLGATFGASAVSRKPGLNVAALFGLAGLIGLYIAPIVYFTQLRAGDGASLSPQPVLHAFLVAVAGFGGLSAYAVVSRRDFSNLAGFLTMGLFVVIGASLLNLFFGGSIFGLAIASATVLLFGGFVLYDTSRMLRDGESEPVPAALSLYLNFLNLFLALLRIFGGRRD